MIAFLLGRGSPADQASQGPASRGQISDPVAAVAPPAGQKFVGVEVLLENTGDRGHQYFSTHFKIKDPQDRVFASGGLGVGDPPLEWGTIVPGEKVRGHVAFRVPADATGLTLTYLPPGGGPPNYRPIHIDLGQ